MLCLMQKIIIIIIKIQKLKKKKKKKETKGIRIFSDISDSL